MPLGCAGKEPQTRKSESTARKSETSAARPGQFEAAQAPVGEAHEEGPGKNAVGDDAANKQQIARKIVYTAQVEVIVDEFDATEQKLLQLVKSLKGAYIARSDLQGSTGSSRQGTWTVRLPQEQFDDFVAEVAKFGELKRNKRDSEDVTDEYYDLQARIKNKQVEEERLLKHLEKSTGKLEDILAVEKELSRVRGEIERHQGRLKYLEKLTALTTVTITIHERKTYMPPEPQSPAFSTTLGRTFAGSLEALTALGKGLVIFFVALAPWLPILALLGGAIWWLARRARRATQATIVRPVSPPSSG
jgi:hypothetical protein